jgi:malonyl CoA-acyl carrier protein transacylase
MRFSNNLADNIAHGVRWFDATSVLEELGCDLFLEMPPGHVFTDLAMLSTTKLEPDKEQDRRKVTLKQVRLCAGP